MQVDKKILVDGKYFRVCTTSRVIGIDEETHQLKIKDCEIKEGLAIEKRGKDYEGKKNYYVVAFIKPHEYKPNPLDTEKVVFASMNPGVDLKDVNFRTIEMVEESMSPEVLWEMMQEYKNCVEFAKQAVLDVLEE